MQQQPLFQPGLPSPCIFQLRETCPFFRHTSPTGVPEFFCDIWPMTVVVFLPGDPAREEASSRIYAAIASVWQDRRVAYECARVPFDAMNQAKPCEACEAARRAEVVVLDVGIGDTLQQIYRDLAMTSVNYVRLLTEQAALGEIVPRKRVILIGSGRPAAIPPYILELGQFIDYAGPDGQPDLPRLQEEMRRHAAPPPPTDIVKLTFDDAPAPPPAAPPTVVDVPTEKAPEIDIRIVETGTTPTAPAAEPPSAPPPSVWRRPPGMEVADIVSTIAPRLQKAVADLDPIRKARERLEQNEPREALKLLLTQKFEGRDTEAYRQSLVDDCFARLQTWEIVDLFFQSRHPDSPREAVVLASWQREPWRHTTVQLQHTSLRGLVGGASEVPLYLLETMEPSQVYQIYDVIKDERFDDGRPAILIGDDISQNFGLGIAVLSAFERDPRVCFMQFDVSTLKHSIRSGESATSYLERQFAEQFGIRPNHYEQTSTSVVDSETDFFGRKDLVKKLTGWLFGGTSFALYGRPKSGKSSLLYRLKEVNTTGDRVLALIDFEGVVPGTISEVYWSIAKGILDAVREKYPSGKTYTDLKVDYELFTLPPSSTEPEFRLIFADQVSALVRGLRATEGIQFTSLILMFDEIEEILPDPKDPERRGLDGYDAFLMVLRSLINQNTCTIGFAGYGPKLKHQFETHRSSLATHVQQIPIGMLDAPDCAELVSRIGARMLMYYRDESLAEVFRWSGGDPYWTKRICSRLFEKRTPRVELIEPDEVARTAQGLVEEPDSREIIRFLVKRYRDYYPAEFAFLRQAAAMLDINEQISRSRIRAMGVNDTHLADLLAYGWLREEAGAYTIASGLIHSWIASNRDW